MSRVDIDFFNEAQNRPTKVRFWYSSVGDDCGTRICLSPKHKAGRVAVVSHGAFGSPLAMSWLAEPLAARGWLVAGVAHYGESWFYGTDTIDPSTPSRFWQRPQDLRFVMDQLSNEAVFNIPLKTNQVLAIGHSSGGFSVLALAGARLESGKTEQYCQSELARLDKGCSYVSTSEFQKVRELRESISRLQQAMADSRVAAVVAMDPALGYAVSESTLRSIKVPTLIFGSVENDFLPYEVHAKYYAREIPASQLVPVNQGAGHFVYTNSCELDLEAVGVPICKDRAGVDRDKIQMHLLEMLLEFLSKEFPD